MANLEKIKFQSIPILNINIKGILIFMGAISFIVSISAGLLINNAYFKFITYIFLNVVTIIIIKLFYDIIKQHQEKFDLNMSSISISTEIQSMIEDDDVLAKMIKAYGIYFNELPYEYEIKVYHPYEGDHDVIKVNIALPNRTRELENKIVEDFIAKFPDEEFLRFMISFRKE